MATSTTSLSVDSSSSDYSPSSTPTSLSSPACCTKVGCPADFSMSSAPLPTARSPTAPRSASMQAAPMSATSLPTPPLPNSPSSAASLLPAAPLRSLAFLSRGLTSRRPPAMLLAGATGDVPLLPSSPEGDVGVSSRRSATKGGKARGGGCQRELWKALSSLGRSRPCGRVREEQRLAAVDELVDEAGRPAQGPLQGRRLREGASFREVDLGGWPVDLLMPIRGSRLGWPANSYNLPKRLSLAPTTRATLNKDSLTSYILQDEAMQEAEWSSEFLLQVNYVARAKQGGRPGQRGQSGGGGSNGWKPTKDANKKSAKNSGCGGVDVGTMAAAVQVNPSVVLIISGCSHHLMGMKEVFVNLQPSGDVKYVCGFNGALQDVQGRGTIALHRDAGKQVLILDVLYVTGVHTNLLSAS
ncbi:unnamed protein product [Closterium sp. NIES-54]